MSTITKGKTWADNENVTYTDLNGNFDTIYNEFNGSISNTNIAAGAAIASTKISGTAVTLAGTETLTNKTLTSPKVGTSIADTNGNEIIKTPATASAVNEITVTNAATGNAPTISATGGDTNIDLKLTGQGSGKVSFGTANLKLPNSDGSSGQVLKTDGSGVLSFGTVASIVDEDNSGSSVTTSSTFANISGADVSVTTTITSHIIIMATVSAYQNSGSTVPYGIQIHDGSSTIGVEMRSELPTGNARTCTTIQTIAQSKAAGTYTYTVQHRSQNNSASITAEVINVIAFSVPA